MKSISRILTSLLAAALLGACASTPKFDTSGIDPDITPQQAAAQAGTLEGVRVLWGGVIIASSNLEDASQLEILAYPLDSNQRPNIEAAPLGRFLARQEGYLETTDYAQGRLVSISGMLQGSRAGRIGESEYTYPVITIEQLHLWPRQGRYGSEPRFHFGIGVLLSN